MAEFIALASIFAGVATVASRQAQPAGADVQPIIIPHPQVTITGDTYISDARANELHFDRRAPETFSCPRPHGNALTRIARVTVGGGIDYVSPLGGIVPNP